MTTATTNPPRKSAGLKSVTVMADSIDYGDEMKTLQRIWDELVRDVRADAYVPEPLEPSMLDQYLAVGGTYDDTPLFSSLLQEFNTDTAGENR